jgi:hypothetical protein
MMTMWPNKSPEPTAVGAAVPLSRFTSRVGGGSAFFVRRMRFYHLLLAIVLLSGCSTNQVHISRFSSDEQIRSELLVHTPLGSSGTNVLRFVAEDLHQYKGKLWPVRWSWHALAPHNTIDVELAEYPIGKFFTRIVLVRWGFDEEKDVLIDIQVCQYTVEGHSFVP